MRTTVTLDPDVLAKIKSYMREKGVSFKDAINTAIRIGLSRGGKQKKVFRQKSYNMGTPSIPLRKALQLASEMEDQEIIRDLTIRK
jgi:hypothetical protein